MSKKRFCICAVTGKNRDDERSLTPCMIDLKGKRFFFPANFKDMGVAVRQLCLPQPITSDDVRDFEISIRESAEELTRIDFINRGRVELSEAGSEDSFLAAEEMENAEAGDQILAYSEEERFEEAMEQLMAQRSTAESLNEESGGYLVAYANSRRDAFAAKFRSREMQVEIPKTYLEQREDLELGLTFIPKTFFIYERDFTFDLADVPETLRKKENLHSLRDLAWAYQQILEEIDISFHPENKAFIERSRNFKGLVDAGNPDADALLYGTDMNKLLRCL